MPHFVAQQRLDEVQLTAVVPQMEGHEPASLEPGRLSVLGVKVRR